MLWLLTVIISETFNGNVKCYWFHSVNLCSILIHNRLTQKKNSHLAFGFTDISIEHAC